MPEWTAVTVIATLVGLFAAVIKPLINLNTTLTTLITELKALRNDFKEHKDRNSESHARIWAVSDDHDARLDDHETRMKIVEEIVR